MRATEGCSPIRSADYGDYRVAGWVADFDLDVEQILANAFGDAVVGNVERVESEHDLFFCRRLMVASQENCRGADKMGVKHIQATNGDEAWKGSRRWRIRHRVPEQICTTRFSDFDRCGNAGNDGYADPVHQIGLPF